MTYSTRRAKFSVIYSCHREFYSVRKLWQGVQVLEAMSEFETEDESVNSIYNDSESDNSNSDDNFDASASDSDANSESSSCCDDLDAPPDSSGDETPTNSAQRRGRGRGRGRGCRRGGRGIRGRHSVRGGTAAGRGRAASSSPLYVWTTVGEGRYCQEANANVQI